MSIEQQIADLTTATTDLLDAVNVRKSVLDDAVQGVNDAAGRLYAGTYDIAPETRPDGSQILDGDRYINSLDGYEYIRVNGSWSNSSSAIQAAQIQADRASSFSAQAEAQAVRAEAARDAAQLSAGIAVAGVSAKTSLLEVFTGINGSSFSVVSQGDASLNIGEFANGYIITNDELISVSGALSEVLFRTSGACSGEIRVYEPVTSTTWRTTYIIPVSFAAGGIQTVSVANGMLASNIAVKAGGIVGYKTITGGLRAGPSGGLFKTIEGDSGIGSIVTNTGISNPVDPALQVKVSSVASLESRVSGNEANITAHGTRLGQLETDRAKIVAQMGRTLDQDYGAAGSVGAADLYANSATLTANGNIYAPVDLCPESTTLESVSFRHSGPGSIAIKVYKKITATSWECTHSWPYTVTAASGTLETLKAGEGVIPSGFTLGVGDFVAVQAITTSIRYVEKSGGTWVNLVGGATVGATATRNLNTNGYVIAVSFALGGVANSLQKQIDDADAVIADLQASVADFGTRFDAVQNSASLLLPGAPVPTGWRKINASISGLEVIRSANAQAATFPEYDGGVKGFAVVPTVGAMFEDTAKTTPAGDAGDFVASVLDYSPNNVTIQVADNARRPVLKLNAGRPYLEFDGVDDELVVPASAFGTGAMAFVCSVALRNSTPSYPHVLGPLGGGSMPGLYAGFQNAKLRWGIGGISGAAITSPSNVNLNEKVTISYIYTGSALELYLNGTLVASGAASGTYNITDNHEICPQQGVFDSAIDFYGGIYVARNITAAERQRLEESVTSEASASASDEVIAALITNSTQGASTEEILAALQPQIDQTVNIRVQAALEAAGIAPSLTTTKAYSLGDSTVADYTYPGLIDLVSTQRVIVDIATSGDTIAGQKSKWLAQTIDPSLVGWVVVQIGLNDMNPNDGTTASKIAALQDLINTIRGEIGSTKKILISKMLPCRQRYIDVYGATNGPLAQQRWVDVNAAIAGEGATPITGVDARITAHVPLMDDGNGNLKAIYDTGDKIHPNLAGRQLMADEWKKAIWALGLVV